MEQTVEKIVNVDPALLLADDNIRFSLRPERVVALADEISAIGYITTPLWVEDLQEAGPAGELFRVTAGNYRRAAALKLNKEQNAGIVCPCIVRNTDDPVDRLKLQLSENKDRENLSPLDMAIAIDKLLTAGVPRIEVRTIFSRPSGKKGALQPASNAWINIIRDFLKLPKAIQAKIHQGVVGVEAAYELGKVAPEKRQAILDRIESERERRLEGEEKDEEKFLAQEKKEAEAVAKAEQVQKELEAAKQNLTATSQKLDVVTGQAAELYKAAKKAAKTPEEEAAKKAAEEQLKAAEEAARVAEKEAKEAKASVEKLATRAETMQKQIEERAAKLAEIRKAAAKSAAKKPITAAEVKKADQGHVALKLADIRQVIAELQLPGSYEKVSAIGKALQSCFDGITTNRQLETALATITGEKGTAKPPKGKAAKAE